MIAFWGFGLGEELLKLLLCVLKIYLKFIVIFKYYYLQFFQYFVESTINFQQHKFLIKHTSVTMHAYRADGVYFYAIFCAILLFKTTAPRTDKQQNSE